MSPLLAEEGWIELLPPTDPLSAWRGKVTGWVQADSVSLNEKNPRRLTSKEGKGIAVNGLEGRASNLVTKEKYTDLEAHVEFLVAKGSNSGVKMMGLYEIQIHDSHDAKELKGDHCGGVYPRGENKPRYHTIDNGIPPRVNAAKPPGEWQTLDITFQAPRFDDTGKKVSNARFLKVVLNGKVVQENAELLYPTGAAWRLAKEIPEGPFFLQGDHGPVAFRNVRIRPLKLSPK